MSKHFLAAAGAAAALLIPACALANPVNLLPIGTGLPEPASNTVSFDDLNPGPVGGNGVSYDAPLIDNGVQFGKMFVGQTLSYNGNFDVLTGTPTAPLTLTDVTPGQNLVVYSEFPPNNILVGDGHLGYPDADALGEGAISFLFSTGESKLAFNILGGNGGDATVDFFGANGGLLQAITLTNLFDTKYVFETDGGLQDIRGVTITNNDLAGISFDDLQFDQQSTIGEHKPPIGGPPGIPEPSAWALMLVGFGGAGAMLRRSRRRLALA